VLQAAVGREWLSLGVGLLVVVTAMVAAAVINSNFAKHLSGATVASSETQADSSEAGG
jgi:hypothetical protein